MDTVSVSVPENLREKMKKFSFINWSQVANSAFGKRVSELEFLEEFKSKSDMTEQDALELGRKVNASLARRYAKAIGRKK